MKVHSLARRTLVIVLTAQVLYAIALSGFITIHEARAHLVAFDVSLGGKSDSLLGAIQDAEDVNSTVQIDPAELRVSRNDVFAVYNRGGSLLGTSANAPSVLIQRGADEFRTVRFRNTNYRVLQREALRVIDRAEFGGVGLKRPVTIVYASPETHVWHAIFSAISYFLIAIFAVGALSILFVGVLLRRALHPLDELAEAAGRLSAPSLRFDPPASALLVRELRPLAEVLTESVDRLRETFDKEQRFVGDAAHELKTAVAVVRSSIQLMMLKRRTSEEYETGLYRVLEDNVRVENLVNKMLHLASVSEANVSEASGADDARTDLGDVAVQVIQELDARAEEQKIVLRATYSPNAMVSLPRERARILLSNLLMNAIQHSLPGSPISVSVQHEGSTAILLKVEDAGSGIGEAALPYIFDRFYREDRSRSRDTGGTGLGLSICKAIVDSAGGTIEAVSKVNVGTTITVVFSAA